MDDPTAGMSPLERLARSDSFSPSFPGHAEEPSASSTASRMAEEMGALRAQLVALTKAIPQTFSPDRQATRRAPPPQHQLVTERKEASSVLTDRDMDDGDDEVEHMLEAVERRADTIVAELSAASRLRQAEAARVAAESDAMAARAEAEMWRRRAQLAAEQAAPRIDITTERERRQEAEAEAARWRQVAAQLRTSRFSQSPGSVHTSLQASSVSPETVKAVGDRPSPPQQQQSVTSRVRQRYETWSQPQPQPRPRVSWWTAEPVSPVQAAVTTLRSAHPGSEQETQAIAQLARIWQLHSPRSVESHRVEPRRVNPPRVEPRPAAPSLRIVPKHTHRTPESGGRLTRDGPSRLRGGAVFEEEEARRARVRSMKRLSLKPSVMFGSSSQESAISAEDSHSSAALAMAASTSPPDRALSFRTATHIDDLIARDIDDSPLDHALPSHSLGRSRRIAVSPHRPQPRVDQPSTPLTTAVLISRVNPHSSLQQAAQTARAIASASFTVASTAQSLRDSSPGSRVLLKRRAQLPFPPS
jgi:hypothetical protein